MFKDMNKQVENKKMGKLHTEKSNDAFFSDEIDFRQKYY